MAPFGVAADIAAADKTATKTRIEATDPIFGRGRFMDFSSISTVGEDEQ